MTRFLVILLVMLLPLRGWSVERMEVQMAHSQVVAQSSDSYPLTADMPMDCPMMDESAKGFTGCQSCQLCMALTGLNEWAVQLPMQPACSPSVPLRVAFVSADPKRLPKTPIL